MKLRSLLLLAVAIGAVAGLAYQAHQPSPADKAPAASAKKGPPPTPVTVARVAARDMPVVLELVGRGEAFERVVLKSRVDGQVQKVSFDEGRAVAQGAVLIQLDPADFQARVAQAQANLARDQALLKKARADVARYQALQGQGFVSEEKVAELRAGVEAGEAGVAADQAALELARLQLGYTTVRAPFAGVVGDRRVHPGAAVKTNETELAEVSRVRPLLVTFAVPEKHLPAVRAALAARRLGVSVQLPGQGGAGQGGPGQGGSGKAARIDFMDPAVDPATGTLRMKAQLPNADAALAPGQFLNVALVLDTLRQAPVVPAQAVQQGPEGSFVYVLNAEGAASLRPVQVTTVRDGLAVIGRGLALGDTVITDGHSRLVPGGKVKVKEPGQKAPAGPAAAHP
jgi:multidrug efflux system membrane fusion protein